MGLCSGMIVGMGESYDDVVSVAEQLRALNTESIPVNFLLPIAGNPLTQAVSGGQSLTPQYVLRVLCMMRLMNPPAEIRIAAGREAHLRTMQPLSLWPANSLFMEGYLLSEGDSATATLQMILDAGFTPKLDEGHWPEHLRNMSQAPAATKSMVGVPLKLSVQGKTIDGRKGPALR